MRVLFVHDRFGDYAGAEVNLRLVAAELKQRGHACAILHGPGTERNEAEWREIFTDRFALDTGAEPLAPWAALQAFHPEVIYVHNLTDLRTLEQLLDSGVPAVRMVHDHSLYCMRTCKYHYFSRRICERPMSPYCVFPCGAFVARNPGGLLPFKWVSYPAKMKELAFNMRFHSLIVATGYMKGELVRNGFERERIAVHPPVPRTPGTRPPVFPGHRNRILFAGQIVRGKGVDVLLRALARLQVPFECFICGEGSHRAYCERLSRRLGLEAWVRFLGFVTPPALEMYYQDANVVAVSSVWPEPFGAVGLEAMAHGLPVVAFNVGGISEWLVDGVNGFLIPWMNDTQFASCLELLLRDKALARRMGFRGFHMVRQRFDFAQYVTGLEELFARVQDESTSLVLA